MPVLRRGEEEEKRKKKKKRQRISKKLEATAESCCRCLPAVIFLFFRAARFTRAVGQSFIPTLYAHMEPRLIISVN